MEDIGGERNHEDDRNNHTEDPDILQIVNSIQEKTKGSFRVSGEQTCTIYQVSKVLRQVNEKCYEPHLASIGPYHINKKGLKPMEEKKFQYLQHLIKRNRRLKLEDLVEDIKKLEAEARECYSESISLESKEFVEMMVVDGCFLVEIFLRNYEKKITDELWLPLFISHDMLLLENQLPFFILQRIFSLVVPIKKADLLKRLLLRCFKLIYVMPLNKDAAMKESCHHVLDMFHHHCLPKPLESSSNPDLNQIQTLNADLVQADTDTEAQSHKDNAKRDPDIEDKSRTNPNSNDRWARMASWLACIGAVSWHACIPIYRELMHLIWKCKRKNPKDTPFSMRSAEELQEAGIEIKMKVAEPAGSFLDLDFDEKGVLEIPYLYFSDNLQTIFQNLIAFEQCCPKAGTFFTGYAFFMDNLINTAKDVRILRHARILEHGLGSDDEVAQHFNEMCRRIFVQFETIHLSRKRKAINNYCEKKLPKWRARLARDYFNSPWAFLSVLAAVLLLLLTITQTVFSILPNV